MNAALQNPVLPSLNQIYSKSIFQKNDSDGRIYTDVGVAFPIRKDLLLGTINIVEEFSIIFKIKITSILSEWSNILHLTTGLNSEKIPGIYISPNSTYIYVISPDINTYVNYNITLNLNQWYTISYVKKIFTNWCL